MSTNPVEIDEAALVAEATAVVDAAQPLPDPGQPQASADGQAVAVVESWEPAIKSVVPILRIGVFPQWDISDDEAREFTSALSECLDQAFPGGLSGHYACWFRLVLVLGMVPATRYMQTGRLPPLGPKLKEAEKPRAASNEVPQA